MLKLILFVTATVSMVLVSIALGYLPPLRTASTRWSPTPSTSSVGEPSASSRRVTAIRLD
jgi:hypothetical protein